MLNDRQKENLQKKQIFLWFTQLENASTCQEVIKALEKIKNQLKERNFGLCNCETINLKALLTEKMCFFRGKAASLALQNVVSLDKSLRKPPEYF